MYFARRMSRDLLGAKYTMATTLVPVGHDAGAFYAGGDSATPEGFDVRSGNGAFTLGVAEYLIWDLAHGDLLQAAAGEGTTRKYLLEAATQRQVPDAESALESLLKVGAVAELATSADAAHRPFAEKYRMVPLTRGLGNTPEAPFLFRIATLGVQQLAVTVDTYYLWLYSHLKPSLWQACVQLAEESDSRPHRAPGSYQSSPEALLAEVISALPQLIAGRSIYIDGSI